MNQCLDKTNVPVIGLTMMCRNFNARMEHALEVIGNVMERRIVQMVKMKTKNKDAHVKYKHVFLIESRHIASNI